MRRLATLETTLASTIAGGALLLALVAGGCTLGVATDDDDTPPPGGGGVTPPPGGGGGPAVNPVAIYNRGSLVPQFDIIDTADRQRINPFGITMQDTDITTNVGGFISVQDKMLEIEQQIAVERGAPLARPIISDTNDQLRAELIPFRAQPTDVDLVIDQNGVRKAVVPLGGDFTMPGNEVAIVDRDTGEVEQVKVGIRPVATTIHEDGIAFVCNQYSNYISVVDVTQQELLLRSDGTPVEIATEYYCSDILLQDPVIGGGQGDLLNLYVANEWRGAVLRYAIQLVRDPFTDEISDVVVQRPQNPISTPDAYITGAGPNPTKLRLADDQQHVYVANGRGGTAARIDTRTDAVLNVFTILAPTVDIIQIGNSVMIPTTTIDRGYLVDSEVAPQPAQGNRVVITGLNGQSVVAHPGTQRDDTLAYNFDDLRNGVFQADLSLTGEEAYYTDNISPEQRIADQAKVLSGATALAAETNAARNLLFLANGGSDQVQALQVVAGQGFRLREIGQVFDTEARPIAMALDEDSGELLVVEWGRGTVAAFDLQNQNRIEEFDLGYAFLNNAGAIYPATNMEIGQYLFYNADWSNNGRKACTTCHGPKDLISDGLPYANGATAATVPHNVRPNWNLLTTNNYFWNGSFTNGSYATLAFAAQTRTTCEQIVFATIEGPSTPANVRVGDADNNQPRGFGAADAACRPDTDLDADLLPANFNVPGGIADTINDQKAVAANAIAALARGVVGQRAAVNVRSREDVSRFIDYWSVYELRLPVDPLTQLYENGELSSTDMADITEGQQLFVQVGCANCHDPNNSRAPFTDGLQHGVGADWNQRFVDQYQRDARVILPQQFIDSLEGDASIPSPEINIHLNPGDFFAPFCFDDVNCLQFQDPLAITGDRVEETRRLNLINQFNLGDPDRGHMPGQPVGAVRINTPSLRGAWWSAGYLHHSFARTFREAILAPGHPALRPGEFGYAVSSGSFGEDAFNSHGATKDLTEDQVVALEKYIETIQ